MRIEQCIYQATHLKLDWFLWQTSYMTVLIFSHLFCYYTRRMCWVLIMHYSCSLQYPFSKKLHCLCLPMTCLAAMTITGSDIFMSLLLLCLSNMSSSNSAFIVAVLCIIFFHETSLSSSSNDMPCSDEKYRQFEADRHLKYKCPVCRGDCYKVLSFVLNL